MLLLELQKGNEAEKGLNAGHEGGVLFKCFRHRNTDGLVVLKEGGTPAVSATKLHFLCSRIFRSMLFKECRVAALQYSYGRSNILEIVVEIGIA